MKHKTPLFIRKGNVIKNFLTGELLKIHGSINKAKRASAKLQRENGGLGMGALIVENPTNGS